MSTKRWLIVVIESLLVAWVLLYVATYFDVPFVREAGGTMTLADHGDVSPAS